MKKWMVVLGVLMIAGLTRTALAADTFAIVEDEMAVEDTSRGLIIGKPPSAANFHDGASTGRCGSSSFINTTSEVFAKSWVNVPNTDGPGSPIGDIYFANDISGTAGAGKGKKLYTLRDVGTTCFEMVNGTTVMFRKWSVNHE